MTLPPVMPPTDDRLRSNPIAMVTTTAQLSSTHSSKQPYPLTASSSSSTQQSSLTTNTPWTNELTRAKEKSPDISQLVNESFTTGWVGGASSKGKMKEKKYSTHESKGDDEYIVRLNSCEILSYVTWCEFLESNGNAKSCTPSVIIQWKATIFFVYSCLFAEEGMDMLIPACVHAC